MDTPIQKIPGTAENWENGTLGCDPEHVKKVSPEKEKEILDSLGLERVQFLIPKETLGKLRKIAAKERVVEQVVLRTALIHYADHFPL